MKAEALLAGLPAVFERFPGAKAPRDERFGLLLDAIPGLSTANVLALLNHAASLVGPAESYLEIGTYKGLSLTAAMLGNPGSYVAVDNFSHPGSDPAELRAYLDRVGLGEAVVLEGDAASVLRHGLPGGRPVGVCYLDASHEYCDQLAALELVEPHLADDALIVVDDADWDDVTAACDQYLRRSSGAGEVMTVLGTRAGRPEWWHGVRVLSVARG